MSLIFCCDEPDFDAVQRLRLDKGIVTFEDETVRVAHCRGATADCHVWNRSTADTLMIHAASIPPYPRIAGGHSATEVRQSLGRFFSTETQSARLPISSPYYAVDRRRMFVLHEFCRWPCEVRLDQARRSSEPYAQPL